MIYKVIKSKSQYADYCKKLETLVFSDANGTEIMDEIDLLTVLIEKWDAEHNTFQDVDPIRLLHSFMEDHQLKPKDLVEILRVLNSPPPPPKSLTNIGCFHPTPIRHIRLYSPIS